MLSPASNNLGLRVLVVALAVLLMLGGRAQAVINSYLSVLPQVFGQSTQQQGPVEEEEEHRHPAGKVGERRERDRVPAPRVTGRVTHVTHAGHVRAGVATHVRADSGADLRNGIGAPLRC